MKKLSGLALAAVLLTSGCLTYPYNYGYGGYGGYGTPYAGTPYGGYGGYGYSAPQPYGIPYPEPQVACPAPSSGYAPQVVVPAPQPPYYYGQPYYSNSTDTSGTGNTASNNPYWHHRHRWQQPGTTGTTTDTSGNTSGNTAGNTTGGTTGNTTDTGTTTTQSGTTAGHTRMHTGMTGNITGGTTGNTTGSSTTAAQMSGQNPRAGFYGTRSMNQAGMNNAGAVTGGSPMLRQQQVQAPRTMMTRPAPTATMARPQVQAGARPQAPAARTAARPNTATVVK